jgi:hypothetical protein
MQSTDEVAAGEFSRERALAESLAEFAVYWDSLGELTPAREGWKAFELELRKNLVGQAQTREAAMPATWLVKEIRCGRWEKRQQRNLRNLWRNQARLMQWRRKGYTFDSEHRLVAPQRPCTSRPRQEGRAPRSRRQRTHVRAREPTRKPDDDPEPESPGRRFCAGGCGESIDDRAPQARTCGKYACQKRAQRQRKHEQASLPLIRRADAAYELLRRSPHEWDDESRLELLAAVVWPTSTVLGAAA